ncbi:MAG: alpha/beta hydrolase, partial [Chloroflexota bacterium]
GLGDRPILLIHGMEDSMVDYRDSEVLYDAAPGPKELWLVPRVDHCGAYFLDRPAYVERTYRFFETTLREPEPVTEPIRALS